MHVITWNVNGLRAITNKDFFNSGKELNADVICLQETKASCREVLDILSPLGDYYVFCTFELLRIRSLSGGS